MEKRKRRSKKPSCQTVKGYEKNGTAEGWNPKLIYKFVQTDK